MDNTLCTWIDPPLFKEPVTNLFANIIDYNTVTKPSWYIFNLLPDDKILDWSKLKQIADDILKCI